MNYRLNTLTLAITMIIAGCSQEPPKCSDPETFAVIRQIIVENLGPDHPVAKLGAAAIEKLIVIQNARASSYDEKVKKFTCDALLVGQGQVGDQPLQINIKYESQLDDSKNHLVSINNLSTGSLILLYANLGIQTAPQSSPSATLSTPENAPAAQTLKEISITGVIDSGTDLSNISSPDNKVASFANDSDIGRKIFAVCKVDEKCSITATVDGDDVIQTVKSISKTQ